jgi:hypothetical protein
MKQILFYATRDDLIELLELVESKGQMKYARMGNFASADVKNGPLTFESGSQIPDLGKASADSSTACEAFLVCHPQTLIISREIQGVCGNRICIDQLANPDSIEFKPAGIRNDNAMLHGRIGTASDSQFSQFLMKRFEVAIKRSFLKIRAYYVGPNAFRLLASGKRFTISLQSDRIFDLTMPESTFGK